MLTESLLLVCAKMHLLHYLCTQPCIIMPLHRGNCAGKCLVSGWHWSTRLVAWL